MYTCYTTRGGSREPLLSLFLPEGSREPLLSLFLSPEGSREPLLVLFSVCKALGSLFWLIPVYKALGSLFVGDVYLPICLPVCLPYTSRTLPVQHATVPCYTIDGPGRHGGLPRVLLSRFTVGQLLMSHNPLIHPFHCWSVPQPPSQPPVSLLGLPPGTHGRGRNMPALASRDPWKKEEYARFSLPGP